jgi:hypothetical protein
MLVIITKVYHCTDAEEPEFSYECICEFYVMLAMDTKYFSKHHLACWAVY